MTSVADSDHMDPERAWFRKYSFFIIALRAKGLAPNPDEGIRAFLGTEHEGEYLATVLNSLPKLTSQDEKFRFTDLISNSTAEYDPTEMINLFNQLDNPIWRGIIAGRLAQTNPINIGDWFAYTLENEEDEEVRASVAWAVGFSPEYSKCRTILIENYGTYPKDALNSFDQAGGEAELELLSTFDHENADVPPHLKKGYLKQVPKVINKLEKRVERQRKREEKERIKEEKRRMRESKGR